MTAEVLKRNELAIGDLAWLVPHQANGRIIEAVAKRLGLGLDRVIINLDRYGNTVGATIPIALSEWNEQGKFTYGDLHLFRHVDGSHSRDAWAVCDPVLLSLVT